MDNYILQFPTFTKKIIYRFIPIHHGGIGDCIKFFMYLLNLCIQYKIQLYFQVHNSHLEKFLKLKYSFFYIYPNDIVESRICSYDEISNLPENIYNIVMPVILYTTYSDTILHDIKDVFYFSNEVLSNKYKLYPYTNYISIHLRLGDKFLETEQSFIQCYEDTRSYNEEEIFKIIEENKHNNILFLCDNQQYKFLMLLIQL
jgi:hypothetical protein